MILLRALLAACIAWPALAACVLPGDPIEFSVEGTVAVAKGTIVPGAAGKLAALLALNHVTTLDIASPGGDVAEAAAIANTVRVSRLDVIVQPKAMCASACFAVFAAGKERTVSGSSFIGVHRAAICGVGDSQVGTDIMSGKSVAFGTPSGIVQRMISTPQPAMAWLTADDLLPMGVRILP